MHTGDAEQGAGGKGHVGKNKYTYQNIHTRKNMIHTKKIHTGDTEQGAGGKGYLAFLGCSSARENPGARRRLAHCWCLGFRVEGRVLGLGPGFFLGSRV